MKEKLLIVDDSKMNRNLLKALLKDNYVTDEADGGRAALDILEKDGEKYSAILLDLRMPDIDGFAVLDFVRESGLIKRVPVLIISADSAADIETECFEKGVSEFIKKPFKKDIIIQRIRNIVDLFMYKNSLEEKVASQTFKLQKQYKILEEKSAQAKRNNEQIIDMLGTVVEYRNIPNGAHIKNVKKYTRILAELLSLSYPEYELTPEKIDMIVAASALHDIGKIAISDTVLLKPGRLSDEEFEYMKSHTLRGCDIIEAVEGAWDEDYKKTSYDICRYHHERFDGNGYPDRLKGDDIPISAQIVSIADAYDALTTERVYKDAYDKEKAYHMVIKGECGVFSPRIIEAFRKAKENGLI